MSVANYFTFIRLIISPFFLLIYTYQDYLEISSVSLPYILITLLLISELSDAFDGYFARLYNQVTDLGKILDPMADSIARTTVFLTFTQAPINLPVPLIFIFLYRDSVVSTLRTICALKGLALAARTSGKVKAFIQAVAAFSILLLMISQAHGYIALEALQTTSAIIVTVAAVYTLFSGLDYIYANRFYIARLLTLQGAESAYLNRISKENNSG